MSDIETTAQLEEAKASRRVIPAELSFEEIIKNSSLPPCSLNDFMDYLYHVEQDAENLQFFLWYCDYVRRWSNLLPRQKALSPIWDREKAGDAPPSSRFIRYSHKRATSDKMNKIMSILEMSQGTPEETAPGHRRQDSASTRYSRPRTSSLPSIMSPVGPKEDWKPFTIPPFRDEVTRVVKHYISEASPRQLNLTQPDRDACLHAASQTTHPSALLPAFVLAEANLKGCSHPAFIRWSTHNATKPRLVVFGSLSVFLLFLGLAMDTLLILSGLNPFLRILCVLLWWPGVTVLVAASRYGLCLFFHFKNVRQVRPWELAYDETEYPSKVELVANKGDFRKHARKETSGSTVTISSLGPDPLRKPSLQTFGPKNEPEAEPWTKLYASRPLYSKVFGVTVPVQNPSLQLLQDRAVFRCILWGGLVGSVASVASLFVPSGNLW